jgi:nucleoside-diphosphate-sugar epimerase
MTALGARIVITGGAGFLGTALARSMLGAGQIRIGGGSPIPILHVVLADIVTPPPDLAGHPRVSVVTGALADTAPDLEDADLICHLAGVVSGAAEADFDLGMATNLDALRIVLERARRMAVPPVVVFTSSLAVFGSDPAIGPIGEVDDDTLPRPQSSYGTQKFVGEQLVADYTRKGFLRGRSARLMTVAVRPGKPNAAASSFISSIIREPLAGTHARCPVPPDTPIALSSPARTLEGIRTAIDVGDAAWGSRTALNLPALTTSPIAMAEALDRVGGPGTSDLIDWTVDDDVLAIVGSWPARLRTPRAQQLGLRADPTFDDVITQYLVHHGASPRSGQP